tara:strand:- start:1566 stop:3434 length:1869 start_codon:yes stop_codon:yes gene_type:complete
MSKGITDILTRHQVLLERYKTGKAKDYTFFNARLQSDLVSKANSLKVDTLNQLTKKELRGVVTTFTKVTKQYQKQITEDLTNDLRELAKEEALFEAATLKNVTKNAGIKSVAGKAFAASLAVPISANGALLESFVKGWSNHSIEQVNGLVRNGWKEGLTLNQFTQRLRGTKANNFKDGLVNLRQRQAEAVIRTSVQHVSATSRATTWEANKDIVVGYKWVSTLDQRTTEVCRGLDGRQFKLDEGGPQPPIHIGCRSTTVPVLDPKLGLDSLDEGGTRSSLKGAVPANETYYDWLKKQPKGFQEAAIGKGKTKLLNDGVLTGKQFANASLDKNFKPFTLAELKANRDVAIKGVPAISPLTGQAAINKKYPKANPKGIDTLEQFQTSKGVFTPERQLLHDQIVEDFFKDVKPVKNPIARMTGGGPASGKSSIFTQGKVKSIKNAVNIDSDEIKKYLPEYNLKNAANDATAAAFAHEESSYLSKIIMEKAARNKNNLFLDGTGDSGIDKLIKKAKKMRLGGQKLVADYVTVDTAEAVRRNVKRFEDSGRMVPNKYVRKTHAEISKILPEALERDVFDEVTLWDTNTKDLTIKVMDRKNGVTTIYDEGLWQRFLRKTGDVLPEDLE